MKPELRDRKIGLALGGGAVLGAAHIGVLKAFEDAGMKIHCLAGTSSGAVIGLLYAFRVPLEEIEDFSLRLKWSDAASFHLSRVGLLSNEVLGRMVQSRLSPCCLQDASLPVAVLATDLELGGKVVLTRGDIKTAVMATTCIPVVFEPVERNGRMLADGGLLENVPLSPLKEMGADFLIGVDLTARRTRYRRPNHMIEVIANSIEIVMANATRLQTRRADILICPELGDYSLTDPSYTDEVIEKGYAAAWQTLKEMI
jgi:NTE family protein